MNLNFNRKSLFVIVYQMQIMQSIHMSSKWLLLWLAKRGEDRGHCVEFTQACLNRYECTVLRISSQLHMSPTQIT
jgi:hypothetical protein